MPAECRTAAHTRIVILGAGFGGLYTALHLERTLARDPGIEITLVNRDNFFLFTPMLHEVAASDLDMTHIVSPIRKLLRRVHLFKGNVEAIDLAGRTVEVSHGDERHPHTLPFDHLVIGLGAVTNFFGLPGLEERAICMKSLGDAIALRNHIIDNLEHADFECSPEVRRPLLNFVVAGGGFAGVETIAGLNDLVREAVDCYPHLDESMLRVVLVHPGEVILPELGPQLGKYTQEKLRQRGVEIRTNTRVASVSDDGCVVLSDGERIESNTLVWTAGTSPNPLLASLPCAKDRGRLLVDATLQVKGYPGVWALGDCAVIPDPKTGAPYPPTAQHAMRQGKVLAHNIRAAVHGGQKKPFAFSTLGQLAAIGRRSGVANILGLNFSGFLAWFLWRTIYLMKLPRLEKRVRVALDWTLDLVFAKDLVQYMTKRGPTLSQAAQRIEPLRRVG